MAERWLLYYITDRTAFPGDEFARRKHLLDKIAEAALAGVDYVQLREKDLSARELESLAREAVTRLQALRTEGQPLRTKILINSRTDAALATGADGVHLRSDDISPRLVRDLWPKSHFGASSPTREPLIGVSCHSAEEVTEAAENAASFAVFAPVFEKQGSAPAGLDGLRQACRAGIPVLALGGVTLDNAQSCREAGAAGVAGIRLFQENTIPDVVHQLRG